MISSIYYFFKVVFLYQGNETIKLVTSYSDGFSHIKQLSLIKSYKSKNYNLNTYPDYTEVQLSLLCTL